MPAYLPYCKISINLLSNNHCLDYYGIVKWWFSNANIFSAYISWNSINNNCLSSAIYLFWDIIYTGKGRINDSFIFSLLAFWVISCCLSNLQWCSTKFFFFLLLASLWIYVFWYVWCASIQCSHCSLCNKLFILE